MDAQPEVFCDCVSSTDLSTAEQDKPDSFELKNLDKGSAFSVTSEDLQYIDQIKKLVSKEKTLKREIKKLERKENAYTDQLSEAKNIFKDGPNAKNDSGGDFDDQSLSQVTQQLREENKNLEDQVQDLKLELKQVKENVEGPLRRELDRERRKCEQLEDQIVTYQAKQRNVVSGNQKEIDFLSKQLENAKRNIVDLNLVNRRLKEELCVLNCKCNELQNDLIQQKLGEVDMISRLSARKQSKVSPCVPKENCLESTVNTRKVDTNNKDLNIIARNLSNLLFEATECNVCQDINPDLIETVTCIKNLVDIVNRDRNVSDTESCICARNNLI